MRTDEFAADLAPPGTGFVVENEITYLVFPDVDDAMVVFGGGYGVSRLASVGWLTNAMSSTGATSTLTASRSCTSCGWCFRTPAPF